MDKRKKREKKVQEEQAVNRVLLWFGGAVLLELFVLLLNRYYINFDAAGTQMAYGIARFLRVLVWVALAGAAVCALWALFRHRRGKKSFPLRALAVAFGALALCAAIASWWKALGVQFLYLAVPVAAVLALVYYLYQREFFLVAALGALGLFALWCYRRLHLEEPVAVYAVFAAVGLATALAAVGFALLRKGKGRLPGKKHRRVLPGKTRYGMLFAACAVNALSLVLTLVLGATAAYVLLLVTVAWIFGAAVYYTVRLM